MWKVRFIFLKMESEKCKMLVFSIYILLYTLNVWAYKTTFAIVISIVTIITLFDGTVILP